MPSVTDGEARQVGIDARGDEGAVQFCTCRRASSPYSSGRMESVEYVAMDEHVRISSDELAFLL